MNKTRKILIGVLVLLLGMNFLIVNIVSGESIQRPVVYSYYWPISNDQKDLLNWNMETPTIIDVKWQDNPEWLEAKVYWEKNGKTILYRVNPFKDIKNEDEMYAYFVKNLESSKGIAVDEIVTQNLTKIQAEMFINVLRRVRESYPDRIIAVWCSGDWNAGNSFVLEAIRNYADMFIPELYIPQRTAERRGLGGFKRYINTVEKLVPGITKKTIMGIGVHTKMANDPSQSFRDHVSAQITLLGTDPFFSTILGVALYAPVYLSTDDQKWIDSIIKKYFNM
jgi:hypothetical protein